MYMRGKKAFFNEKDVMNFEQTLKPIIYAGLVKYKKTHQRLGFREIPFSFLESLGVSPVEDCEDSHQSELLYNLWMEEIDKMIYAFGSNDGPNLQDYLEVVEEGIGLLGYKIYQATSNKSWEEFSKASDEHCAKVVEGQLSFGKYFQDMC